MTALRTDPPITAGVVVVTPAMAERWLASQAPNRNLNRRSVERYAAAMCAGEWQLTGEAIKFDREGKLLDGAHRLTAIVATGCTVPMLVVRGIPSGARDVMDTGRNRAARDVLSMHGYQRHSSILAAAARLLIAYDDGTLPTHGRDNPRTNKEILEYVETHPDLVDIPTLVGGTITRGTIAPSIMIASVAIASRADADDAVRFGTLVGTGVGLAVNDPILVLRDRMARARSLREQHTAYVYLSATLRAFLAWRDGTPWTKCMLYVANGVPTAMPRIEPPR